MSYVIKEEEDKILVEIQIPPRTKASDERVFMDFSSAEQILLDNGVKFGVLLEGRKIYLSNNFAHEPHRGTFIFSKPQVATQKRTTKTTGEKVDTPKKPRRRRTNKLLGTKDVE